MLDPRFVAEHPDVVKGHLRRRHADDELHAAVDEVVTLAERRGALIVERDELRNRRNVVSKQIGQLMREGRQGEAEALKGEVTEGNTRTTAIEDELALVEARQHELLMGLPNLLDDEVHEGATEDDNAEIRRWGDLPAFDFEPQAHVEVGEGLGIIDLERSARLTGARFSVLRGAAARLERALINFYLDLHTDGHGYTEVMVPYLVHRDILEGTGQLPKFEDDLFRIDGKVNGADTFLIPTAEVPVTNLHRDEILDEEHLPVRYACFTPCFRAEAGSAGRDVRGLIRQHQFHKVELVWITTPEGSEEAHHTLLGHAESCLVQLGLPYRVVRHCGGETSFSARKAYDLEVWLPSQDGYREISSVSNFGDFQARRMALRYRPAAEGGRKVRPRLAHTLNGSGLAVGRTLVAILENNQQADGSVVVPEVLRPYMGGLALIEAAS